MKNVSPEASVWTEIGTKITQKYGLFLQHWHKLTDTQIALVLFVAAIVASIICYAIVALILKHWHAHKDLTEKSLRRHVPHFKAPLRALIPGIIFSIFLPFLKLPPKPLQEARHAVAVWLIVAGAWLAVKIVSYGRDLILSRYHVDVRDNLQARRMYTQIRVIERLIKIGIIVFMVALVLMSFNRVREVGISLMASAGVMGIILGLAAQRTLGNVIAGIQIAIAQPIRLEDVVIVENEWGWIEEITLTYVVVRIWDLRRLIVPISYFIEKPFQNWTRISADLLGSVFLYADYSVPVGEIRRELLRILQESSYWDKKVGVLQVTNATKEVIEIRALMSAEDSPTAWNLRCEVREKLIDFMQKRFPTGLPRFRIQMERDASADGRTFSATSEAAAEE
ncbi:MAG: mechanosensitive ion channel [Desulfobacterales bacterium]